jgi:MATE family multidrug resistance protein
MVLQMLTSRSSNSQLSQWSFEITTILAGLLGVISLDAHIITLSVATFLFMSFPFAVGIAASIRVGQLIGEQRATDARRSSHASLFFSVIIQTILSVVLLLCKDVLGHLFSTDEEVATLVSVLIPISCLFMMGDAVQGTIGGVFRGLGRQKFVLLLNILGFWVCAVPIGAVLTFVAGFGVEGLWWGFNIGIYTSAAVGIWFLRRRVDWNLEAKKAMKRLSALAETNSNSSSPVGTARIGSTEAKEATFQVESC